MNREDLIRQSSSYLKVLCEDIAERCVGSEGNRAATEFFERELSSLGWSTETRGFDAVDWRNGGATLRAGDARFAVSPSPYSLGCTAEAQLVAASTVAELESLEMSGGIILLHDEIAREQLMPKNFVFYNPEEHRRIISLLEGGGAKAIICATGRNSALAGGAYPFPLIEDGDFNIPSVYMTDKEGEKLSAFVGKQVKLESLSERVPGKGFNVIGRIGADASERIVITAHIDAKKGTPGAIDNATGVIVLLLTARLLADYHGEKLVEIVALNGEDYYAVPGQMDYIAANQGDFDSILLDINIDGAGYRDSRSAFSFFGLPADIENAAREVLRRNPGIIEGEQWPQGDHSIFVQYGRPALAVTSEWFIRNMNTQDVTHTPKDNSNIVDCGKLVEISEAIKTLVTLIP